MVMVLNGGFSFGDYRMKKRILLYIIFLIHCSMYYSLLFSMEKKIKYKNIFSKIYEEVKIYCSKQGLEKQYPCSKEPDFFFQEIISKHYSKQDLDKVLYFISAISTEYSKQELGKVLYFIDTILKKDSKRELDKVLYFINTILKEYSKQDLDRALYFIEGIFKEYLKQDLVKALSIYKKKLYWSEEDKVLTNFLLLCPKEPEISFVEQILKENSQQDLSIALYTCGKKLYWSIVEYLIDTFSIEEYDLINLLYVTARLGELGLFKKVILKDNFFDKEQNKIKDIIMNSFVDTNGRFFKDISLSACIMRSIIERSGSRDIAALLIDLGGYFDENLFFKAIKEGHLELVILFLEKFPDLSEDVAENKVFGYGNSNALCYAVNSKKNKLILVNFLLYYGERPDMRNDDGHSPLELLLQSKRDFDEEDIAVVNVLFSISGYYAHEIATYFMRENNTIFLSLDIILNKIEERQRRAESQKYTLSKFIWDSKELKQEGVDQLLLEEKEQNYKRAFFFAVKRKNFDFVCYFLNNHGEKINDKLRIKGIKAAISIGRPGIAFQIIKLSKCSKKENWECFFRYAADNNSILFIYFFVIKYGAGYLSDFSDIILKTALAKGHLDIVKYVDKYDIFSLKALKEALFTAIKKGNIKIVDFLTREYFSNKKIIEKEYLFDIILNSKKILREDILELLIERKMIPFSQCFLQEEAESLAKKIKEKSAHKVFDFEKKKSPHSIIKKTSSLIKKRVTFEDDNIRVNRLETLALGSKCESDGFGFSESDGDIEDVDDLENFFARLNVKKNTDGGYGKVTVKHILI